VALSEAAMFVPAARVDRRVWRRDRRGGV